MKRSQSISRVARPGAVRRFVADESGTTLIELAMVISIFLALFFIALDFGRMASEYVMTEKAVQRAARVAIVRPPVCATALPAYQLPAAGAAAGTFCRSGSGVCASFSLQCTGDLTNETFQEIWWGPDRVAGGPPGIRDLLPQSATPASLTFKYTSDPSLGFVGGPISGIVTVELTEAAADRLTFRSVFPLYALLGLGGANASAADDQPRQNGIPFPMISVSLPSEDLSHRVLP